MPGLSSLTFSRLALEKNMKPDKPFFGALGSFFARFFFSGFPSSSPPPPSPFDRFARFAGGLGPDGPASLPAAPPRRLPLVTAATEMPSSATISASPLSSLPSPLSPLASSSLPLPSDAPSAKSSSSSSVSISASAYRMPGSMSSSTCRPRCGPPGPCAAESRFSMRSFFALMKSKSDCHSVREMLRNWCSVSFFMRTTKSNVRDDTTPPPWRANSTPSTSSNGSSIGGLCT
mmetsp:Transcript_34614/g.102752  ORF Transcript_34614/g.102752 Transcript_34614/m.102752 type:complete len:232 (-) Transcript_34614:1098-1793(-)